MHGISKITKCKINGTGVVGKTRSDLALEKKSATFIDGQIANGLYRPGRLCCSCSQGRAS